MLREELIHPALIHFPISCLILILFTKSAQIFMAKKSKDYLKLISFTHYFLLFVGLSMLLPVIFLGDMALDVIKGQLCSLTTAYKHEELSQMTLIIFILVLALEVTLLTGKVKKSLFGIAHILILFFIGIGDFYLIKTAHLGGILVYEQGAAVKIPGSYDCNN